MKTKEKVFLVGTLLFGTAMVVAGLEIGAGLFLRPGHEGQRYPFFYNPKAGERSLETVLTKERFMAYLDPHLSHSQDPAIIDGIRPLPGFAVYGEDAFRIVVLGGSTSEPDPPPSWPKQLQEKLASRGYPVQVLNGAVAGNSSNQELLKLIRDVLPLEPDLVLTLSGINDLGFAHSVPKHPMVHPYQLSVLQTAIGEPPPRFLPNLVAMARRAGRDYREKRGHLVHGINLGPEVNTTPEDQWMRNVRLMHALCAEEGIGFVAFRQPVLCGLSDPRFPDEKEMIAVFQPKKIFWDKYLKQVRTFYADTAEFCRTTEYCVDIADLFEGKEGMYRDPRHQTERGRELIAERVLAELLDRKLLPEPAALPVPATASP